MINETKASKGHVSSSPVSQTRPSPAPVNNTNQFFTGIVLALASSVFIGTSFILKKKGLLKLTGYQGAVRAGSGGFGYLREIQWWAGLITMGLGEVCNFAAYGFAPASVVTPLGALSILVSALLAVRFLGEKLNTFGKIGCLLTISGSIVIIIHAPKDSDINSLLDFANKIKTREFIYFSLLTCFCILCLIVHYGPRLGSKHIHIYILICSLLGAFTVTACKGLGIGLRELVNRERTYSRVLTFFCALVIVVCILVQMVYLNRALDLFPTPLVTTVYYVLFTTCVLITSGILFREWETLTGVDIFACLIGFAITTCGLILINYLKSNSTSNETSYSYLPSTHVKQQQQHSNQVKSYADLLADDEHLSSDDTRQPVLLIDEQDLHS